MLAFIEFDKIPVAIIGRRGQSIFDSWDQKDNDDLQAMCAIELGLTFNQIKQVRWGAMCGFMALFVYLK